MLKQFERRTAVCFFVMLTAMFLTVMRVVNVALAPEYSATVNSTAMRTVTLAQQRGTIFDCNMEPITNRQDRYVVLVTDVPSATVTLRNYYTEEETADILSELKSGSVPIINSEREITGEGVISYRMTRHSQSMANHLIGYTDDTGHGVSGLEAVFDDILYSESKIKLSFSVDGLGSIIKGDTIEYEFDSSTEKSGVMTTIDSDIQLVAERAADALQQGAVVVAEVATGRIKAMVSRPDFDLNALGEALGDGNSPLLNRALLTYNVGSVFKPCVAAAALESGKGGFLWHCQGYSDIDGQIFRCHKTSGHSWQDLGNAVKHSCNAFFYNLAIDIGARAVYETAQKAGFNNAVSFGYGLTSKTSQIGDMTKLCDSNRALANLAIGQGDLMLSPVAILTLYCAIASDGGYYPLSLIKGEVKDGELIEDEADTEKIELMSEKTAAVLRECLAGVLSEGGTGDYAKPQTVSAGGKTATAQTGIIRDGKNVINSWFCGFFPLEEPQYAVAVLSENSSSGCGGVFAEIADGITALKNTGLSD